MKLVDRDSARFRKSGAGQPLLLALVALAVALLATLNDVDQVRRPVEPKQVARQALLRALELGNSHPEVQEMLVELRQTLGRRPLESRTRVIYASLLVELSRRLDDTRAAAFHAARAAELAPVTVPVVHLATLVLVRTGDRDRASTLIRAMFAYDESSAAEILGEVERLMQPEQVERSIAGTPAAWLAWSRQLRALGRADEAVSWIRRAHRRFPEDPLALQWVVELAITAEDWATVRDLIPPDRSFPDEPASAPLLLLRARLRVRDGDPDGARAEIDRALALDGARRGIQELAGRAFAELGEIDMARRQWNRALFQLGPGPSTARPRLLRLMARLEDEHGLPAAALRLWERLLEIDPGNVEATRRRDDLTGFQR